MQNLNNSGSINKRLLKTLIILIPVLIVVSVSVAVVAAGKKKPNPQPDAISSYVDESEGKVLERVVKRDNDTTAAKYVRTENLKSLPVEKRKDSYGTYDVYADKEGTEYLYLFNTNLFCGFKKGRDGIPMEKKDAIAEEEAKKTAQATLLQYGRDIEKYIFESCTYIELRGYYEIKYYTCLDKYKTDDTAIIWVSSEGEATAFSEFNYQRYLKAKPVTEDAYNKAEKDIKAQMDKAKIVSAEVKNTYLTYDDAGKMQLCAEVQCMVQTSNEGNFVVAETRTFTAVIK